MTEPVADRIFGVSRDGFDALALELFAFQYEHNPLYKAYADTFGKKPGTVRQVNEIPFLPIAFFKTHEVKTGLFDPAVVFTSSGTTGQGGSRHFVKDLSLYEESFQRGFRLFYGDIKELAVMALLPSYLERQGSSLVYMAEKLIKDSENRYSRFYLDDTSALIQSLQESEKQLNDQPGTGKKNLLLGVTYALLDLPVQEKLNLRHTIIMETGGMKGRRKEMVREEVHALLCEKFGVETIHSEYGMTELLSQAYSSGRGIFRCPPWMRVLVREEEDPLRVNETGTGAVNVIDLANIHSCCFIATDDGGRVQTDGSFEILGRLDGSDMRGCSLLTV